MSKTANGTIAPMQGAGFYNKNSSLQAAGISMILPLLEQAAASVALGENEPLVIADFGASQGRNSMVPMRVAIAGLRARAGADRPIEIVHTDLPANDFASLFVALHSDPESYLTGTTGVFPFAIGRSYFEPILPPGRVHLGWNSWTLQWLSRHPRPVPDHLNSAMSADPIARAEAARQAADDWVAFPQARSSELRPGGKFVSLMVGRTEMTHWRHSVLSELWAAALDLAAAGRLNGNELLRINLPTYARSVVELAAPFQGTGRYAGLSIEHAAILDGPDPVWDQFQELRDAERLGRARANAYRAIFGPTILAALDPERDREATVDALFTRHAERLANSPQRHENYLAVVVLVKDVGAG